MMKSKELLKGECSMQIPYIVEPSYANSIWAKKTLNGMRTEAIQKKYTLIELDGTHFQDLAFTDKAISENHMVLVIGTSYSWVPEIISWLHAHNISAIVINYDPPESLQPRGVVHVDYPQAMRLLIDYLQGCHKNKIALYGLNPNSSTDMMKKRYLESIYSSGTNNIFYNEASLSDCYQRFKTAYKQFDSVICANDIAAVSLLSNLKEDGISVPDQLFITSFGHSTLAARTVPGITTVSLDHVETGRQAIRLYAWLSRQDNLASVSVRIRARLTIRESTAMLPPSELTADPLPYQGNADFYSDAAAQRLFAAEQLLSTATETDFQIMRGLLNGLTYEALQEQLFLSDSSLRYHIRYLMESAGVKTRLEFLDFLHEWKELI